MQVEADVSDDGILTAKLPDRYRGRPVRVMIEDEDELASAQWAALTAVLDRVEPQRIAQRSHREILEEVRGFRESE
ncbi:hypothetical protein [Candidatus Thiodictyon syntrophicum]|jgi:hypothetical protein|uniref:Uncharacterized protein n=1 Tax=Candidatus Thiodictyon syntrophicum TaxID=1166950 RepID=A0A2K8UHN7_9GAMM|nr:hypothetical protein [Candidatus Thiodictyon syntrophicum]AUB85058.1 hypothetical protein THSYN_29435 [Candidatus Thiodictyon syntrophicum]